MNILVQVPMRAMAIFRILRRNPTMTLIASSGDIVDLPAGFLASRIARTSFFAYIFDDYVYQWTGFNRRIAKFVSPVIFRNSNGVIGPNEFICEEYHRRYGVKTFLIRNPCSSKVLNLPAYQRWPLAEDLVKIVYTGAVYHANSDCFRNLLQALEILRSYDIQLHIFTAQTIQQVEAQGIKGKNTYIRSHLPYNDVLEQQRQADILFLPLTFEVSISEVIRTSAPGKMGEYLASQRPVLAHVPRESFVSYYFNKYQCGAVADENDASKLAAVIEKLITDSDYRLRLTGNARRQAILDFSADSARSQLMELLPGQ